MPIPIIAAAVAGAGAIGAAAIGSSANKKAAQTAANSAQHAADQNALLQREIYGQNKETLSPFVGSGTQAGGRINALLGLGGDARAAGEAFDAYRGSTGYDFRVSEGNRALNTGYAARGLLNSGAAQKAALQYGQGLASQEFGNYLGALGNQQNVGLSAGNALAGVGTNFANSMSANNNALAGAQGNAALVGAANNNALLGTAANTLGYLGGQFISSYGRR
jgi:hypothetical protein